MTAAIAAARAAAESSSARVAEAAAEAARVGMLDETRQASREAAAKHAAELAALEAEWQAKVEALLEAQAELERLAAEEHTDAEERQRAVLARVEEARAELAQMRADEQRKHLQVATPYQLSSRLRRVATGSVGVAAVPLQMSRRVLQGLGRRKSQPPEREAPMEAPHGVVEVIGTEKRRE